jgi:hypothetical protein
MRNSGFVWLAFGGIVLCSLTSVMHGTALAMTGAALVVTHHAVSGMTSRSDSLVAAAKDSTCDSSAQRSSLKWYSMITNIPGDWAMYYKQKIQPTSIPEFLGLGLLTAGLIVTDDATYEVSDRWYKNSRTVTDVSDFFVSLGDGKSQFALGGAFAAYGLITNDQKALRTGSQIVQAVLASGAVVQVLKHITGRESPFVRSSPTGIWKFFPDQIEYHKRVPEFDAFPSGHICTALATVIVIAENYPDTKWIRPVGYIVSGLVGVGMVNKGIHWYSDYPLGLAIGYAFGMIAAHPDGITLGQSTEESKTHVNVSPTLGEQGIGLSVSIVF